MTIVPPVARPGEDTTINVQAGANAVVGLSGIDKSLLYLAGTNDLTNARVSTGATIFGITIQTAILWLENTKAIILFKDACSCLNLAITEIENSKEDLWEIMYSQAEVGFSFSCVLCLVVVKAGTINRIID